MNQNQKFQKKNKKKKEFPLKIKLKNDGVNDWPKNCTLCCNQKIEEINNFYFKDTEINKGKEVKKGKEIDVEVIILPKNNFDFSCEDNYFFINYEVKIKGVQSINKKIGTICIEYKQY